jgi:hypothetical protein
VKTTTEFMSSFRRAFRDASAPMPWGGVSTNLSRRRHRGGARSTRAPVCPVSELGTRTSKEKKQEGRGEDIALLQKGPPLTQPEPSFPLIKF